MAWKACSGTLVMWVLSQTRREKDTFWRESRCFSVKTPGFSHQNLQRHKQGLHAAQLLAPSHSAKGEGRRSLGTCQGLASVLQDAQPNAHLREGPPSPPSLLRSHSPVPITDLLELPS